VRVKHFLLRYPVTVYFVSVFCFSWLSAFCIAAPGLLKRKTAGKNTGVGFLVFPYREYGCCLLEAGSIAG
jgi:hypothetical protein